MYQTLAKSPNIKADEIEKEVIKKAGFDPARFMVASEEQPNPENMSPEQKLLTSQL